MSRHAGRDYPTASVVNCAGPLGAVKVQEALDLLALAGPFFTTEDLGTIPLDNSFSSLKVFQIATGSTRKLLALVMVAGGTAVNPLTAFSLVVATAKRTSGGVTTALAPATVSSGFSGFTLEWAVSGVDVSLNARATGNAGNYNATIMYAWIQQLPPP